MTSSLSDTPTRKEPARRHRIWLTLLVALAAVVAIGFALVQLHRLRDGLIVSVDHVGTIPVTIWREKEATTPAPVVVIAHGFAGSQQLMQPFAITLARNGYVAVTFDFPGHGLNPIPLTGGLADAEAMQHDLVDSLAKVVSYAQGLSNGDGRLAVVGHSMAADVVVRFAAANPRVQATIAVSLFVPTLAPVYANNLLIVDGALEPSMLRQQAFEIAGQTISGDIKDDVTYGDFPEGSARRVAFSRGVEHIGVLYSADTMHESLAWLSAAFDHTSDGFIDARGKWLGLLLIGCIALAWPLSTLLPRIPFDTRAKPFKAMQVIMVAIVPAVVTPLVLWKLPTDFLPILLGDYIALHFGIYGLLTAAGIWWLRRGTHTVSTRLAMTRVLIAIGVVIVFNVIAIGLPLDAYVFSFLPGVWRYSLIAIVLIGTLPYFLADEYLTRYCAAMRGSYPLTKLCFLVSLVIAIALNLEKLFFLVIIVPVIILLFLIYGLFSAWIFRRTGNAFVAASANAVLFAWFIAVTFPLVSR